MQLNFGTGTLWAAATTDALGNNIANPTPIKFGVINDITLEMTRDLKELYGQLAFPVAVGGGKMKIDIKAKFSQISGRLFNDLFLGQGMTGGSLTAAYEDLTGAVIPATPFQLTVTPPNTGTIARDLGVLDSNGVAMQQVASAPTTGQYSRAGAIYTFAAADTGKAVYISYTYTYAVGSAKSLIISNVAMGGVPVFGIDLSCRYQGKQAAYRFVQCSAKKIGFDPKQDDFTMLDMDIAAFADPVTGSVGYIATTE